MEYILKSNLYLVMFQKDIGPGSYWHVATLSDIEWLIPTPKLCELMYEALFDVQPTAKVIWRRDHGLQIGGVGDRTRDP